MVKLTKPAPKTLEKKPKLDNPIKQKKEKLKKEKLSAPNKAKLLEDSTPVKEAKASLKNGKEVDKKQQKKKELNGDGKIPKKSLIPEAVAPVEASEASKKKKKKDKNVAKNGLDKIAAQPAEVVEKVNKKAQKAAKITNGAEKPAAAPEKVEDKPSKKSKKEKSAAKEETIPAPVQPKEKKNKKNKNAPELAPQPVAAAPVATEPKKDKKKKNKESVPVAETTATPPAVAPKKEKKWKAKKLQAEAAAAAGEAVAPAPKENEKKKKNKKAAKAVSESTPKPALEKIKKPQKPKKELDAKKKVKVAFKMQQQADKGKPAKQQLKTDAPSFRFDPIPYDEETFHSIVNEKNIKEIAEALKATVEKEIKTKKSSIFEDYRYFLQVANFKIAMCPKRMVKLNLKHPIVDKDDDVLLVVPDLQRGGRADFEPTKEHYEDLLKQNGVEGVTVMPMNQLRKEYGTFEAKRKLCATYEHFMVEGRISGHVTSIIGKFTQKPRNVFHSVHLNEKKDIKTEIEKALRRTAFRQLTKGSLQTIPVGSHKFSSQQLADNILLVVEQLKTIFPGGLGNIRNMHLRIGLVGTTSLPLYMSMGQAPEETPNVVGPREERMIKLKKEANEVLSKFTLTKEGKLLRLTKEATQKKRKLQEMAAAIKEDGAAATKKAKKAADKEGATTKTDKSKKKNAKEVKDLELPENEEDNDEDEEDQSSGDEELQQGSEDEESEDDEMGTESGAEIVENGFVGGEDDEESDDDEVDGNEDNEDDDDDEEEDDDDDDEDDGDDDEESD